MLVIHNFRGGEESRGKSHKDLGKHTKHLILERGMVRPHLALFRAIADSVLRDHS